MNALVTFEYSARAKKKKEQRISRFRIDVSRAKWREREYKRPEEEREEVVGGRNGVGHKFRGIEGGNVSELRKMALELLAAY